MAKTEFKMDVKGIAWVGRLYEKFETMCLEVEDIICQVCILIQLSTPSPPSSPLVFLPIKFIPCLILLNVSF